MVPVHLEEAFIKHGLYLRNWSKRTAHTYRAAFISLRKFQASVHSADRTSIAKMDASQGAAVSESNSEVDAGHNTTAESCGHTPENKHNNAYGSVNGLTKQHLEAWVCWLRDTGVTPGGPNRRAVTPGGCNMYIRTVNSFLNWLSTESGDQPPLKLKLLRCPTKQISAFSDSDVKLILSFRPSGFYDTRTWNLILLLVDTGIRIDEALTLPISKVDFDNLVITVIGKGNKERVVPFSSEARKMLFRYVNKFKIHRYLFETRNGEKLMYRNTFRDIQNLCKKAGITRHVHPHLFRHCFAVTYIRRGGDIYRLSRILGHSSVSTSQIYLRSMGVEIIAENHSNLSPLTKPLT